MFTTLSAALAIVGQTPSEPAQLWFMFFMKGPAARPADPNALTQMQTDHIKNLETQGSKGNLVAAGPLVDPTQQRRGITVAIAKSRQEVDSFFTTDPFVKSGVMTVVAAAWDLRSGSFSKDYDPKGMEEYELLITQNLLLRSVRYRLSHFAVGGRTKYEASEKYRFGGEVWISRKVDHAKLEEALEGVAAEREIIPLWMAKGLLKPAG